MGEKFIRKMNLDALGIGASLVCALHCAALPLLLTILPLLGWHLTEMPLLEYGLLVFSFLVGTISLGRGYFRLHRRVGPLLLFILGFTLLLTGHFLLAGKDWELFTTILIGAISVTGAHIWNIRSGKPETPTDHCLIKQDAVRLP
ncbi:MerC domain-containing protein [Chitinophaga sp. 30R24]|uniref:MerC domain-containing protein n=1 Tax=Chitinophaga sp. 30R24 TaxID=3248838 RepID=UPI003B919310